MHATTPFRIAEADPAMIDALVGLMQRAYRGDESRQGWTSEADLIDGDRTNPADMAKTLADPTQRMLVALAQGAAPAGPDAAGDGGRLGERLVGCASIALQEGSEPVSCIFGKFAVEPRIQGGGLGKALLEAAEQAARDVFSARRMTMTVIAGRDELIAFYARRGYLPTGGQVRMSDIHNDPAMTRGHELVLLEFAKDL